MKKLSRDEMKRVMGGRSVQGTECAANCNPGFVSIDNCNSRCTATTDEGVTCGTEKKCCPGFIC